jgi:hypothetical protein
MHRNTDLSPSEYLKKYNGIPKYGIPSIIVETNERLLAAGVVDISNNEGC